MNLENRILETQEALANESMEESESLETAFRQMLNRKNESLANSELSESDRMAVEMIISRKGSESFLKMTEEEKISDDVALSN